MKINNETKVGALASVAITILILGYNFMKGEDLFAKKRKLYAVYHDVDGLATSNPILVNGFKVGQVKNIAAMDENLDKIVVTFAIDGNVRIGKNSIARIINSDLFGGKAIQLDLNKNTAEAIDGDTLNSDIELSVNKTMNSILNPVKAKAEKLLATLDSVLNSVDDVLNDETQKNLRVGFRSLAETLENFRKTSVKIDDLVGKQGERIDHIFAHVESITRNFRDNNTVLTKTLKNMEQISDSLASSQIKSTVYNANKALADLDITLRKINSGEGSLGLLVNDKKLYNNLESSAKSLDSLLVDMKTHPKRYVHFSVFGKKEKK